MREIMVKSERAVQRTPLPSLRDHSVIPQRTPQRSYSQIHPARSMESFTWTTGGQAEVTHVTKIASGAYGEVHKVLAPLSPPS
jgi:hypothetical protein